jgi:hypothetical protein
VTGSGIVLASVSALILHALKLTSAPTVFVWNVTLLWLVRTCIYEGLSSKLEQKRGNLTRVVVFLSFYLRVIGYFVDTADDLSSLALYCL